VNGLPTLLGGRRDRLASGADKALAGNAVLLAGLGSVIVLAGSGSGALELLLSGGALLAVSLLLLLVGGWLDGAPLVLISLPLPALYSSATLRVAPAVLVTALVVAAWIIRRGLSPRPIDVGALPVRPLWFLLIAVVFSGAFAARPTTALREVVNLTLLLSLLVLLTDELRRDPRKTETLLRVIAGVGGVAGVFAVLQAFGVFASEFPLTGTRFFRATLGFGWPNEAGMFMALTLPFAVHLVRAGRGRADALLGAFATMGCLVGLVATFSRGSWIAALIAPAFTVLIGQRAAVLRFWLAAAAIAVVLNLLIGGLLYARIVSLLGDWVVEQRGALMLAGVLMFLANPLVGVGPGGFGAALDEFGPQIPTLWDYTGSAHNAYIHAAAEMGALGVLALSAFFGGTLAAMVRVARRSRGTSPEGDVLRATAVWGFATAFLVSFLEWPLAQGVGQVIMLVAALGFATDLRAEGRRVGT
jgi:O-antigen ligase